MPAKRRPFVAKKTAKSFTIVPNDSQSERNGSTPNAAGSSQSGGLDLEDDLIERAIRSIERVEEGKNEGATFEQLIKDEAIAAGLKGSAEFDRMLEANKGKRNVHRGGSEDSRPQKGRESSQKEGKALEVDDQKEEGGRGHGQRMPEKTH